MRLERKRWAFIRTILFVCNRNLHNDLIYFYKFLMIVNTTIMWLWRVWIIHLSFECKKEKKRGSLANCIGYCMSIVISYLLSFNAVSIRLKDRNPDHIFDSFEKLFIDWQNIVIFTSYWRKFEQNSLWLVRIHEDNVFYLSWKSASCDCKRWYIVEILSFSAWL